MTDVPGLTTTTWLSADGSRYFVNDENGRPAPRARVLVEHHIGRKLRTDEHVHHVNGDATDDRLDNLVVLPASEHARLHRTQRWAEWRRENPNGWNHDRPACAECGTTDRPHVSRGRCGRCYGRRRAELKRRAQGIEARAVTPREQVDRMLDLRAAGLTFDEIGARVGTRPNSVRFIVRREEARRV